ncbi:bifunctional proline dehydrogenase/L-glutamate gamma-semialdehyde dehydrogenase PutA [Moraxella oblonga]|uniref:bifunctional proline dehydrogenase/L-glutamate gamma-semialdehyde dehydrogenase PutA n=1 Tax=Moraxella oblonga TaxID=200413 RepID=UPI000833DCAC|nr:bifunctional proline dehydrogenase/L-glutamate gamma-semialdehyde dehydrogenase PutA [Moraxella oblonga]
MFHFTEPKKLLRDAISTAYRLDEITAVQNLAKTIHFTQAQQKDIDSLARTLITQVRAERSKSSGVDALMHEFSLSSEEGIALMCLAEALLRIPDNATRDKLIRDKISHGDWQSHIGHSPSLFVNASAWGLVLTGKLTKIPDKDMESTLTRILKKGAEPFIRMGMNYAIKLLGNQFITGQTINEALAHGKDREKMGYRFSFDMLGESAMTADDAERYFQDYINAIHAIGKDARGRGVYHGNGISVKLSAIHPRYTRSQHHRVMSELLPKLKTLFLLAKEYDIGISIDAEESYRLELSLDLLKKLVSDSDLAGFKGIGFVVQAYQKRCPFVIDYIIDLARRYNQKLMIRLVKGAYWDSEIKQAQADGMSDYPVYTQKLHTDIAYLACAKKLLSAQDVIFPQFATHNAQTLATIYEMGKELEYEFQCLHGMGETLYDQVVGKKLGRRVRIYAPVGTHKTLLAYLVRRLLENGANSSFVNRIVDETVSIDELVMSPLDVIDINHITPNPLTPNPRELYTTRANSQGVDLTDEHTLLELQTNMSMASDIYFDIESLTYYYTPHTPALPVLNPANHTDIVGEVAFIEPNAIPKVVDVALNAKEHWQTVSASERADMIRSFADLLEEPRHMALLMMLCVREAGKTLPNAIAEVREAIDFCRYYADECERLNLNTPIGTVVAIAPWNFPLAIFAGEVVSALCAGNTVIAKPAEQTSIIAHLAVSWLHEVGIPTDVLQLVLGAGDVGRALIADTRINGVIFTGSTEVAKHINAQLAKRDDDPVLIAETGGMNAMIVDSTALPEQVCSDVLMSAFDSAGQRCSALRILCVQEEIADHLINMIKGAMDELVISQPHFLHTDIGPVIDHEAQTNLLAHINTLKQNYPYHEAPITHGENGTFVAPILFELKDLSELHQEVFGPVLHVVRFKAHELDELIDSINKKGYALTHGIHSRIDGTTDHITSHIQAGNIYINRNIVGAVVGVQPFGGHGLSGTGPKAGGSFYLQRLSHLNTWNTPTNTTPAKLYDNLTGVIEVANANNINLDDIIQTAKETSLNQASITLDSITGEINTLSWHAPESVALYGGLLDVALPVLAILAINGTKAHITPQHELAMYADKLSDILEVMEQEGVDKNTIIIALSKPPATEKERLASLDGAIRRVVDATHGFDMTRLYHEVSTSHNATASGGNASLMASV